MSEIMIKAERHLFSVDLKELWRYRELFYIFAWRDLKVRYKQTLLGVAWAIFQPLVTMVVFTVFFGRFLQQTTGGVPYPVFVYAGLVFWNYFSQSLATSANSLIEHESIIKKIYFPRLVIPIAGTIAHLIDFVLAFIILVAIMVYFKITPTAIGMLLLPLLLAITFLAATGIGLFLAAVNVKYRDVRYIIPFFIQLLIFVTPVIYPITVVSQKARAFFAFNPMAGVIETARQSLLAGNFNEQTLLISGMVGLGYFVLGVYYFRKMERFFADII